MKTKNKYILLSVLFLAGFAGSYVLYNQAKSYYDIGKTTKEIQAEFRQLQQEIVKTISDEKVVSNLLTDSYTFEEFQHFVNLPFGLIVYENDTAVMWTNNTIIPVQAQPGQNDVPLLITEANGNYVVFRHEFEKSNISTIGFLPLRFEYGIENNYLTDIKTKGIFIPSNLTISAKNAVGAYAIHDNLGDPIFYIQHDALASFTPQFNSWFYVFLVSTIILLLVLIFIFCETVVKRYGKVAGIVTHFVLQVGVFICIQGLLANPVFKYIPLFSPYYYASTGIASSIGNLLIKIAFAFSFSLFFLKYFYGFWKSRFQNVVTLVCSTILFFLGLLTLRIFHSLVFDSDISFDIYNFFSLDFFSLVGIFCIAAILLVFLLISIRLNDFIFRNNTSVTAISSIAAGGLMLLLFMYFVVGKIEWNVLLFCGGVFGIHQFLYKRKLHLRSFPAVMTWLIFFSVFSAYIFYSTLSEKSEENKKLFALKKSVEKDAITEYLFKEVENEITRDLTLQLAVYDAGEMKQNILNQVRQDMQNNYFKKYDNDIFIYENDSLLVTNNKDKNISRWYFIDAIENNGEFTSPNSNLYFINDNTGNYYYLAELILRKDSITEQVAFVRLTPKRFSNQSIYPELLIDDELKTPESFASFDYAIYNNNSLIEREGEFSYPIMDVFYVEKDDEFKKEQLNGYDHLVYKVNDNKKVVISEPEPSLIEPFSYFSYLFFVYLLFVGIVIAINFITQIMNGRIHLKEWFDTTLQNKIQVSVISLIVFAFVMMGIATILYIINQYNTSHRQRLLTKIEAVQTNIDYIFDESKRNADKAVSPIMLKRITNRATELSEIHDMDINLFSPSGNLITSSQPDIFSKGLISEMMNPLAYFKMSCDKETWYIQDEMIGKLKYLSAYVPIMHKDGEVLFYLNLPYFATEQNLRAEISSFMVALINVYVLLLVIASILAFTVAQSITRPLAAITGTFKNIKLGKKNESIIWKHNDEIGLLVDEYNTMLKELEKSASLLAKSERESAWRDMAKQVAHEIKNPLTPMRLSIQHLQRALHTNAPNARELTEKVTKTLLEQIDNLSFIASEFSNFAVMPKVHNELLILNDVLDNVVHLYLESEEAEIEMKLPDKKIEIFADKNQLIRVFNNLIKNATQAIPEDREGEVSITLEQVDHRAVIKVKDNGVGIPEDQKDKVFVPNFTTKSSGMGIGLAMSKNIVESAGGYIWFESQENNGTTFFIEFPIIEN